jgi:hypothetical protein
MAALIGRFYGGPLDSTSQPLLKDYPVGAVVRFGDDVPYLRIDADWQNPGERQPVYIFDGGPVPVITQHQDTGLGSYVRACVEDHEYVAQFGDPRPRGGFASVEAATSYATMAVRRLAMGVDQVEVTAAR